MEKNTATMDLTSEITHDNNNLVESDSLSHPKRFSPKDLSAPKIVIALPAYNEEESLPPLLTRIGETFDNSTQDYEVIVVDDGSTDATAEIANEFSLQMPVQLRQHKVNQGLGGTIRDCLLFAVERCGPNDIVVTLDADNTQPPELIPSMIEKIRVGHDIVIASRFQTGGRVVGVPLNRKLMSIFARVMFTVLFPTPGVRDYTCGFRAYRASVLQDALQHYGDKFVTETGFASMGDLLLKMRHQQQLLICEVPMLLRYDHKGGSSKMNVIKTVFGSLRLIARRRMGKMD